MKSTVTEDIDVWTGAIKKRNAVGRGSSKKIELYGIKKIRELVLLLAVTGKLSGNQSTKMLELDDNHYNLSIPTHWECQRLSECTVATQGVQISKNNQIFELAEGYKRYLYISDFGEKYDLKFVQDCYEKKNVTPDDLIMANTGATCGRVYLGKYGVLSNNLFKITFEPTVFNSNYLFYYLKSRIFLAGIERFIKGGANPHMGHKTYGVQYVYVPPLAEQHRIVAKVDELMALCDQLEQQTEDSITAHKTLVETLLGTLITKDGGNAGNAGAIAGKLNGTNAKELIAKDGGNDENAGAIFFQESWKRIAQHFDILFTTEDSIDQLKQTILQLAVMGKLVPQDPNDEPASVLLEKIAKEKERLVVEGKIKMQKVLQVIGEDEKPFELPEGWVQARLGELSYVFAGNSFKSGDFNETGGTRVIKITNAGVGEIIETNDYLPKNFMNDFGSYKVFKGDLVLALTRPYISTGLKVSICPTSYHNSLLNQRVAVIRTIMESSFVYQYMQSVFVLGLYKKRFGGSGLQPNLKMSDVTELVIPVPPINEQKRIIVKIGELLTLCDQLKTRLNDAQTTQLHLADAIVEQAVG